MRLTFYLSAQTHNFLRDQLIGQINNEGFSLLNDSEKLKFLMNNSDIVKQTSQFIINAFDNRLIH